MFLYSPPKPSVAAQGSANRESLYDNNVRNTNTTALGIRSPCPAKGPWRRGIQQPQQKKAPNHKKKEKGYVRHGKKY